MKLTNRTTPQARNYQCDKCKSIKSHINMYDDNICGDCYDALSEHQESKKCSTCKDTLGSNSLCVECISCNPQISSGVKK